MRAALPALVRAGARFAPRLRRGFGGQSAAEQQPAKASAAVKIDFRALTEEGQQVTDLKPDEITLKVNGKPRQIQSLGVFHSAAAAGSVFRADRRCLRPTRPTRSARTAA